MRLRLRDLAVHLREHRRRAIARVEFLAEHRGDAAHIGERIGPGHVEHRHAERARAAREAAASCPRTSRPDRACSSAPSPPTAGSWGCPRAMHRRWWRRPDGGPPPRRTAPRCARAAPAGRHIRRCTGTSKQSCGGAEAAGWIERISAASAHGNPAMRFAHIAAVECPYHLRRANTGESMRHTLATFAVAASFAAPAYAAPPPTSSPPTRPPPAARSGTRTRRSRPTTTIPAWA